jgi:hypothetical protein
MDKGEPPSAGHAKSLFRIGKDSRGNWVVQDQSGLCGGLFVDCAEAVKFAMFENGNRPQPRWWWLHVQHSGSRCASRLTILFLGQHETTCRHARCSHDPVASRARRRANHRTDD